MNLAGFHRRLDSVEIRRRLDVNLFDFFGGDDSFGDETIAPHFARRRMSANLFVQRRLGERWFVRLVVSVTTIAHDVDQEVLAEFRPVLNGQSNHLDARLRIVGVDVNDRNFESLREIAGVACRSRIDWIRRESDLIVHDDVQRSARSKAGEPRQIECLGHHPFPGESGITVHTDR